MYRLNQAEEINDFDLNQNHFNLCKQAKLQLKF